MTAVLCFLILVLCLLGLVISTYFTLVQYGAMRSDSRLIPAVCRMRESECRPILDTPYARVLGLPNSVFGLGFYAFTGLAAVVRWATGSGILLLYALAAAVVAMLVSGYLFYALVWRLRRRCPLCFAAQGVNAGLAVLLAVLVATGAG